MKTTLNQEILEALEEVDYGKLKRLIKHPSYSKDLITARGMWELLFSWGQGGVSNKQVNSVLNLCLKEGFDVNTRFETEETLLHIAVFNDPLANVVRLILKHHPTPNARAMDGWTPLHIAVEYHRASAVKLLIEAGHDPTVENSTGQSALDIIYQSVFDTLNGAEKLKPKQIECFCLLASKFKNKPVSTLTEETTMSAAALDLGLLDAVA